MSLALARLPSVAETANDIARAWQEYGVEYAKYPDLWRGCVLATLGPQQPSNRAWDYSGRNNHGTLTNGPIWQGRDGLIFDGVDDYVNVPDDNSLDPTNNLTLSAWFKADNVSGIKGIVFKDSMGERQYGIVLVDDEVQGITFASASTYTWLTNTSGTSVSTGEWHHVLMRYQYVANNTSLASVYLDGSLEDSTNTAKGPIHAGLSELQIGAREYSSSRIFFDGSIDDVRIYNRALSPTEIAQLYAIGRPGVTGGVYQVERPRYWLFGTGGATHLWPWQIRRSRRMAGAR